MLGKRSGESYKRMRYLLLPSLLVILSLGAFTLPAPAQVILMGIVQEDETAMPISGARVEILDARNRQLAVRYTDDHGHFEVRLPTRDRYRLRASRLGYRATTTPILWMDGYDNIHVDLRMDPEAVLLAPLEVVARSRPSTSPILESFFDRQRSGMGHFFTSADIATRQPGRITDLLETLPGVRLESSGRGMDRVIYMSRGTRACPAQVYVDGLLLNRRDMTGRDMGFTLDQAVSPLSVVGMEVYTGLSSVPAEFLSPEASCGVVAVWTRRGG